MDDLIVEYLDCTVSIGGGPGNVGLPPCGDQGRAGYTHDFTMGQWLFWTYAFDQPSLIFELKSGMRVPRHMFDAASETYAIELRVRDPMTFQSRLAPREFRLPIQVARFRGDTSTRTAVLFASILPAALMDLPPDDTLQVGFFLFRDAPEFPSVMRRVGAHAPGQALTLDYGAQLDPGRYYFSLEAYSAALGAAAKARDFLQARSWDQDSLLLSDIVVAHRLEPRTVGEPLTWRDVTLQPSRTLEVTAGASLWLLWETYGLRPGANRIGRSEVRLTVRGLQAPDLPVRVLEGLGKGRRGGPSLEWQSEHRLAPDGRGLDYVAIQLPAEASGRYEVTITVTEPLSGRTAQSTRVITVTRASPRP